MRRTFCVLSSCGPNDSHKFSAHQSAMPSVLRLFLRSLSSKKGLTVGGKEKSSSSVSFGSKILSSWDTKGAFFAKCPHKEIGLMSREQVGQDCQCKCRCPWGNDKARCKQNEGAVKIRKGDLGLGPNLLSNYDLVDITELILILIKSIHVMV
jgi:hypothetical protein